MLSALRFTMSQKNQSKKLDGSFIALIVFIVLILSAGLGSVWFNQPAGARLVKMFEVGAAMLAAAGVMVATFISYRQGKDAVARDEENKQRDKLEETFRLIEKWDDPHFLAARKLSVEIGKQSEKLAPVDLIARVEENADLRSSVSLMLNYFDYIRLSIKHDRVDVEILKQQLGPVAKITLNRFDAWIKKQGNPYLADVEEFRKIIS